MKLREMELAQGGKTRARRTADSLAGRDGLRNGFSAAPTKIPELTINWHILEQCNFECYFCYAKYNQKKSFFRKGYEDVLRELSALKGKRIELRDGVILADRIRINFAGGEPFLVKNLGEAISLAFDLGLNPSFITNGSLLIDDFILEYGSLISVAGFSIDSFNPSTNRKIGRENPKVGQVSFDRYLEIFELFRKVSPKTKLKVNTVVCQENADEDLTEPLQMLRPDRWKALRIIPIFGGSGRQITDEQFASFVDRHKGLSCRIVPEDNHEMYRSYLMIDPSGKFYQRGNTGYILSKPVVEVGAAQALSAMEFDTHTYNSRY